MNRIPSKEEIQEALEFRHTKEIQTKLNNAKVCICGLGGLGSAIAISLARMGVGHLHLVDFDCVDLCNINRQHYSLDEIGMEKTQAIAREIRRFSPYIELKLTSQKITENNFQDILKDEKYICEAFDKAEEKAMLTNLVLEYFPDKFLVGASGMAGYGNSNGINTKRITAHYFLCGDMNNGIENGLGLMAPRVMLCAAHQANKIVELIINN